MKQTMIELNLLPKELRKVKRVSMQLEKIPVAKIAIAVLLGLIALHLLLIFFDAQNHSILKKLTAEWNNMQGQREETGKLTREIIALEKKLEAVRGITESEFNWAKLLSGLNNSVIPNIWLSKLELTFQDFKKKEKKGASEKVPIAVSITGYALGSSQEATSIVAKFITSLKKNTEFSDYFREIELHNMVAREVDGKEVMRFVLNCRLKSADPEKQKSKTAGTGKKKR